MEYAGIIQQISSRQAAVLIVDTYQGMSIKACLTTSGDIFVGRMSNQNSVWASDFKAARRA